MFDSIKRGAKKAQLKAAIALVDRDIASRQRAFGVEVYDKIALLDRSQAIQTPGVFHAVENQMKEPLERCKADVILLTNDRDALAHERLLLEAKQDRAPRALTTGDKMRAAGTAIGDTAKQTQISAKIAYVERQIKQRKEAFGVEVFYLVDPSSKVANAPPVKEEKKAGGFRGIGSNIKSGVSNQLSKFSSKEKQIQESIDAVHRDVAILVSKRNQHDRDILDLDKGEF